MKEGITEELGKLYQEGFDAGYAKALEDVEKKATVFDNAQAEIRGVPFAKVLIIGKELLAQLRKK